MHKLHCPTPHSPPYRRLRSHRSVGKDNLSWRGRGIQLERTDRQTETDRQTIGTTWFRKTHSEHRGRVKSQEKTGRAGRWTRGRGRRGACGGRGWEVREQRVHHANESCAHGGNTAFFSCSRNGCARSGPKRRRRRLSGGRPTKRVFLLFILRLLSIKRKS